MEEHVLSIHKALYSISRKGKREDPNKIRDEKRDITTDSRGIQRSLGTIMNNDIPKSWKT